ncbi:SHOOT GRAVITROPISM 9 [Hibiscus trionum]|uniref:SHOOT GRAVITROPISM 9 n=1 Tax=Hibiscus trionum TaxID=183268 RepID=A0A9W7HMC5_HIBTR|nr:SHOOT GRAVITROPISM 9 [Hibiscus trionum]
MMMEEETTIMAAISTLRPSQISDLSYSIFSLAFHHRRRLCRLLSSPCLFFLTLHRLHTLPLPQKTLLIARHLLFSLHHLTRHFQPLRVSNLSTAMNHRDLDTVLLLFFLSEAYHYNPEALERPHIEWRQVLTSICSNTTLKIAGITGIFDGAALIPYIEMVTRCKRLVGIMGCGGKERKEVAASPAAVVALPSVEVRGGGVECVICREEMKEGRKVCKLLFQLPCDDILGEIQRLWGVLVKAGGKSVDDERL